MVGLKKRAYRVYVDKPCEESWDSMISNKNGKFCLQCSKNIVDFTYLSDQEIIRRITGSSGNLCGRFSSEQLNRPLVDNESALSFSRFYKILVSLLLLVTTESTLAQSKKNKLLSATEIYPEQTSVPVKPQTRKKTCSPSSNLLLKGKVLDSTSRELLPFSTVFIKNANRSVQTDSNGYFELSIPKSLFKDSLLLIISNYGYINREFRINKRDGSSVKEFSIIAQQVVTVEAKAVTREMRTLGGFAVTAEPKKKWWQFWK